MRVSSSSRNLGLGLNLLRFSVIFRVSVLGLRIWGLRVQRLRISV